MSSNDPKQGLNDDISLPEAKRIKIGSRSNGHDSIRNELSISRTPSPQVFSKEKVNVNGQDYVKPATTIAKTCTSFSTGLTSLMTSTNTMQSASKHSIATQSSGQTGLTTNTQSVFTPTSTQATTSTKNTLAAGHTGQTGLMTSARSAFTPPCAPGNISQNSTLSNNASVLSSGTKIAAALDLTNNGGFTRSSGESIEVDDALELLTGPACQWANCTRYYITAS